MKKLIIILVIILSAVMLLGIKYQQDSLYKASEIEKANKEMTSKLSAVDSGEVEEDTEEYQENLPPKIEIIYPSIFKDGDTIETDKVQLRFSDDSEVTKATMNSQDVSTEEIVITTEGTYKIEIQDDTDQITSLTFTLKHEPQETTTQQTTTQQTTTQQKTTTTTPKTTTGTKTPSKATTPPKAQEPVQEPVQDPVQDPVQEPIQDPVQEPIQDPVQEPLD